MTIEIGLEGEHEVGGGALHRRIDGVVGLWDLIREDNHGVGVEDDGQVQGDVRWDPVADGGQREQLPEWLLNVLGDLPRLEPVDPFLHGHVLDLGRDESGGEVALGDPFDGELGMAPPKPLDDPGFRVEDGQWLAEACGSR